MSRYKQIEEMANIIALKAFERAHEIDGDENLADIVAEALYNAGYRKASEVAREIFEEIEDLLHKHYVEWDFCYFDDYLGEDFDELKKKYTEGGE